MSWVTQLQMGPQYTMLQGWLLWLIVVNREYVSISAGSLEFGGAATTLT